MYEKAFRVGSVAAHKKDINKGWIPLQEKKLSCPQCGKSVAFSESEDKGLILSLHNIPYSTIAC